MAVAHFSRALSTTLVNAIETALNAGATGATLKCYTAPMPATTATAITTQTLLATCTAATDCGSESGGTLTFDTIVLDTGADATGTAAWWRIADSDGVVVMDLDCSAIGGSGYIQMPTVDIVSGGPVAFLSFTITLP